jgi:hypothetical protein
MRKITRIPSTQAARATAFTEGPWKADETLTDQEHTLTISNVSPDADDDGRLRDYGRSLLEDGYLVCETDEENRANAKLLAAAPELYVELALLRDAVGALTLPLTDDALHQLAYRLKMADVALATARGDDLEIMRLLDVDG